MKSTGVLMLALALSACAQVITEVPPLNASAEARCADFMRIANDMTTSAYRRATALEQLRAQRCPGYQ
jgi:hypothetical protein